MNQSLKISSSKENLKQIRAFLEKALEEYTVSEEEKNLMILAVDEICANIMIHSDPDGKKELEVTVEDMPGGIVFEIYDTGKPFDHTTVPEPDIATMVKEKRKGGLGLMLVRRIMDSIEFRKENSLTIYRLFKKVSSC